MECLHTWHIYVIGLWAEGTACWLIFVTFTISVMAWQSKTVKSMQSNNRYRYVRICAKLKDPVFLVQLHFLQNLEPLYIPFLTLLQREVPLIHVLHYQLSELVRIIMMRFFKQCVLSEKSGKSLLSVENGHNGHAQFI